MLEQYYHKINNIVTKTYRQICENVFSSMDWDTDDGNDDSTQLHGTVFYYEFFFYGFNTRTRLNYMYVNGMNRMRLRARMSSNATATVRNK